MCVISNVTQAFHRRAETWREPSATEAFYASQCCERAIQSALLRLDEGKCAQRLVHSLTETLSWSQPSPTKPSSLSRTRGCTKKYKRERVRSRTQTRRSR